MQVLTLTLYAKPTADPRMKRGEWRDAYLPSETRQGLFRVSMGVLSADGMLNQHRRPRDPCRAEGQTDGNTGSGVVSPHLLSTELIHRSTKGN